MEYHLIGLNVLTAADVAQDFACQFAAFGFIDLPADDLAAEDVNEQVKVKIDALDLRRQISDVPAKQLGRCTGA